MLRKMKQSSPSAAPVARIEKPVRTAEYSMGVRQISNGYEKYNVKDEGEIYIAKAPESAFQNGGEAVIVKAENGRMVGLCRPQRSTIIETVDTTPERPAGDMFGNVQRGSDCNVQSFVGTYSNGIIKRKPATDTN